MIELDELIITSQTDDRTWTDTINRTPSDGDVDYYGARHLYYGIPPNISEKNITGLLFLDRVHRNELVFLFPKRGKYIADSSLVTGDMVTHEIFGERVRKCIIPIDIGGNHHYRQTVLDIESNEWIFDKVIYKYRELF